MTKIVIHLVGGQVLETYDEAIEDCNDLENVVAEPARPHWCRIGDCLVFTHAIAGLELG